MGRGYVDFGMRYGWGEAGAVRHFGVPLFMFAEEGLEATSPRVSSLNPELATSICHERAQPRYADMLNEWRKCMGLSLPPLFLSLSLSLSQHLFLFRSNSTHSFHSKAF